MAVQMYIGGELYTLQSDMPPQDSPYWFNKKDLDDPIPVISLKLGHSELGLHLLLRDVRYLREMFEFLFPEGLGGEAQKRVDFLCGLSGQHLLVDRAAQSAFFDLGFGIGPGYPSQAYCRELDFCEPPLERVDRKLAPPPIWSYKLNRDYDSSYLKTMREYELDDDFIDRHFNELYDIWSVPDVDSRRVASALLVRGQNPTAENISAVYNEWFEQGKKLAYDLFGEKNMSVEWSDEIRRNGMLMDDSLHPFYIPATLIIRCCRQVHEMLLEDYVEAPIRRWKERFESKKLPDFLVDESEGKLPGKVLFHPTCGIKELEN